jgi:hypothetical protein
MMKAQGVVRSRWTLVGAMALGLALVAGCASQQDKAIEQAKKQAAATGQPQQVVTVDKDGNTTTTTVQPPTPGQTAEAITTTTAPAPPAQSGQIPPKPGTYYQPTGTATAQGQSQPGQPQQGEPQQGAAPALAVQPADVHIPAGSTLTIRINQGISVKTTPAGSRFDGEVVEPWVDANGRVVLPKGTPVEGVVDESHKRGHFKGASVLELRLTTLTLNGTRYPLETRDLRETKKGKGKRSAAFIGGGTGLGALIGGLAGGGKGALIGGLAGAGAGTAGAGMTGNRDLEIPPESVVRFKLANDLTLQA